MEAFSRAYVKAVASTAGFAVQDRDVDLDSIDGSIRARGGTGSVRSPAVEFQLKCTSSAQLDEQQVHHRVSRKNYDELRGADYLVPRILVVVVIPKHAGDWVDQDETQLQLRNCGYWLSLRGEGAVATKRVKVSVPRTQQFTVASLTAMLERVGDGGLP